MEVFEGGITSPKGFKAAGVHCGIKKEKLDLAVIYSEVPAKCAIAYTQNKVRAAPIEVMMKKDPKTLQALVINSGNANAITGVQGIYDSKQMVFLTAQTLGIRDTLVGVASTGVISRFLPMEKISVGIPKAVQALGKGSDSDDMAARAIMTTDTQPKHIAFKVVCGENAFIVGGTAKGAGMIHPDMATMLCFITTDAVVSSPFLKAALKKAVMASFNMVSVDGDTSTNDTALVLASGLAGNRLITAGSDMAAAFQEALTGVCVHLAKCIARDGEGATRMMEIQVNSAKNEKQARQAARTISNSPLVKTAVHGCDPNWGRIIAAAGRSGVDLDPQKADVYIGSTCLLKGGMPLPFDKKAVSALLNHPEVLLRVDLNLGEGQATAWGCDLSKEYVTINADYTT